MKILGVRFKNLNSLAGEWHIDFTHPDYASTGIFAITGPTGAGKTTIMDAICLALYGTTPRLDRVTKSSNEIMSRRTGECFAEVVFETQKGRYRSHWSQHRSRRRPDGELQQARHEIAAADSGTLLESKINQVGDFITEVTGMDFERFTRSMLLAQGGFATFLLAPAAKRGDILEQITGTEIYSRISMQVHRRCAEERDRLGLLQAELQGIRFLSPAEAEELKTALEGKKNREQAANVTGEQLRSALSWQEGIRKLEEELRALDRQWLDCEVRRQEFAPDLARLDRARRALELEGDYRTLATLREQQAREIQERMDILAKLPGSEQAFAMALSRKEAAEANLRKMQDRSLTLAEVIRNVRDLDSRRTELSRQEEEIDKAIRDLERQDRKYRNDREQIAESLNKGQARLRIIGEFLASHSADGALITNLTAISRGFAALREKESDFQKKSGELAAALEKQQTTARSCDKLKKIRDKALRDFETQQRELAILDEEIGALLQGQEIAHYRDAQEIRKDRLRLLIQAREALGRIDGLRLAGRDIDNTLQSLSIRQAELAAAIEAGISRKELLERETANLETQVLLLARIRDLEEERKALEDGRPCPLCGSSDHPYARGNVPALAETELKRNDIKLLLKKEVQALSKLEAAHVRTITEIRQGEKERKEKEAARHKEEEECTAILAKLDISSAGEERTTKIANEINRIEEDIARITRLVIAVEDRMRGQKLRKNTLDKGKEELDKSERDLRETEHLLLSVGAERERMQREIDILNSETGAFRRDMLREVEPYGIMEFPPGSLDALLISLTARRDAWQARTEELATGQKDGDTLKAEAEKIAALLGNISEAMLARRRDRHELAQKLVALGQERFERFGDRNPDQEEQLQRDAVQQAERDLEKMRTDCSQAQQDLISLKEKCTTIDGRIEQRANALLQGEGLLTELLIKAGFADEKVFQAARLTAEEQKELSERQLSLIKEEAELSSRRQDRTEALQRERDRQLTDQPCDMLREDLKTQEEHLKQLQEEIGALKNRLQEDEKIRERQQERLQALEARQQECRRWDELHQLIGSADGRKFRNFAQGLTFEMLISQANRQLRKMTRRYLLIRDPSQPLELNVIDNYQAGEIRSTKNLSGGESFIVSLSLALGLSQMASRNVRVDSLFLDEGFGTLDEEALETALETLASLQQEGKLIGIISHVPALRERIGTRIQVAPETGGRSSITGPGCHRI